MANIRLKRSAVSAKVPLVGDLDLGEMAINTYDGKLFIKKDDGAVSIVEIGGGAASEHYDQEATPTPTATGATWYIPSTSKTYLYINDGTSDLWLDISGTGSDEALPDQTGNNGKFLTTDGANLDWVDVVGSEHYDQEATPTANVGATWYVPSTSKTYLYVNDGTSDLWLDISGIGVNETLPDQAGNANKILTTDGTSPSWIENGYNHSTKSADYTCLDNDYLFVDTSASAVTITLPLSPSANDEVFFVDNTSSFGTNALTVGRNSETIMGLAEDMIVDTDNISFGLIYNGSDWRLV